MQDIADACGLGLPAIFVDAYSGANTALLNCDLISMENTASTIAMTKHLIDAGARHIGFIGDPDHCNSFHERWIGFPPPLRTRDFPLTGLSASWTRTARITATWTGSWSTFGQCPCFPMPFSV